MKKSVTVFILLFIVISFSGAMYYLYSKNAEDPIVYKTENPTKKSIIKKTVATGSIVPVEEVLIKPNISGVIEDIYVEGGDIVKANDLIAKIKVIPNLSALNNARNAIRSAKILLDNIQLRYDRQKLLYKNGVISKQELEVDEVSYNQANQTYIAAKQNYDIVKKIKQK